MCTLHLFYRVYPSAPILFAANRDENLDRAWVGPSPLSTAPAVFGPRDASAGGTWLGVNASGVLVSLANHLGTLGNGRSFCSRGLVVAEALRRPSAAEAAEVAVEMAPRCKSFTLLVADPEQAFIVDCTPRAAVAQRLEPGRHVITNARFGDPEDVKARRSLRRMEALGSAEPPTAAEFSSFLADHEKDGPDVTALCVHPAEGERFGTSSASVVQLGAEGRVQRFLFCAGPPCSGSWSDRTAACAGFLAGRGT